MKLYHELAKWWQLMSPASEYAEEAAFYSENFEAGTDGGGEDAGTRGMRWLEWRWDPDPGDSTYLVDYAYLLRERDGSTHVEHDRHVEGLFPREVWLRLLRESGFEPLPLPLELSDLEPGKHEVFVCHRTAYDITPMDSFA